MKNLFFYFLAAISIFLVACSSSDIDDSVISQTGTLETRSVSDFEPAICYGLEEYNNLLNSFKLSPVPSAEPSHYPGYYGGAYVNDNGKLVILITGNPKVHRNEFVRRCGSENIVLEKCKYPYVALLNQIQRINEFQQHHFDSNIMGCALVDNENIIEVWLQNDEDVYVENFKRMVSSSKMIKFVKGGGIKKQQGSSINPGIKITNSKGANSTMGFRVMYQGKKSIVVSGHSFVGYEEVYLGSNQIGTCRISVDQGKVDAAIAEINNLYEPTNIINCTIFLNYSTYVRDVPVGGAVNLCGQVSGNVSGIVTSTSVQTYDPKSGKTLTDIVEVKYNTHNGDSGGPVYSTLGSINYTTGVHLGSALQKPGYSYYSKFSNVQSLFGVARY